MPTAYQKANAANQAELKRLEQLIANLKFLNTYHNASNSRNWLWYWENNHGNGLSEPNISRIQNADRARNANPANYTTKKLKKKIANLENKIMVRRWMYGYVPKMGANWVGKLGLRVPPHLPETEVQNFRRFTREGIPFALANISKAGPLRNVFAAEGTLKPVVYTARRKPSPAKRPERHLPTLKELAWAAKSANENFETVKTMNNKQLKLLSKEGTINWTLLKPKKRTAPLPANNLTKYRRQAAARVIGKAAKKYLKRKAPQRVKGPSPRSPATLARQANLGIMGGARRSPLRAANNTRITWSRNANGKISIHKTLRNLNLGLTNAQRMVLESMPEKQAINAIRQMARQR
jgi:hypothetical protein